MAPEMFEMLKDNLILNTDSYKYSHPKQYPPGANAMFSYIEARKSNLQYPFVVDRLVFFGLQAFIKCYLMKPITMADIEEAEPFILAHGEPFDRKAWEKVVNVYGGYLPVRICAVPEGCKIPLNNVLLTVECDDPDLFWMASFIETALVRAIWYPTSVATISRLCKSIIKKYLNATCDDPEGQIQFKLHDFGARGASSNETAGIGGMAHLVNFKGSDTIMGIVYARIYYDEPMAAFSIPAAEHSTITSWGIPFEKEAYRNMIKKFGKPGAVFACVSDSYNIFNAAENIWGEELRAEVIGSGAIVVIRPDSGDPLQVTMKLIRILGKKFGYTVNKKGYKVLNHVRIIQGDGVNPGIIDHILMGYKKDGWSAENIAFGMGGALLQKVDRDTFSFAMKCSAIRVGDKWREVFKDPIDGGKTSKKGRIGLANMNGEINTITEDRILADGGRNLLEPVYDSGRLLRGQRFEEIRKLADG